MKKVILFDGVCNLCNASVQYILIHDKKKSFQFASLQSDFGQDFLLQNNLNATHLDTIYLLDGEKFFNKSTAALKVLISFGGWYNLMRIFWILPIFIRDIFYNFVSKNRYKIFGKNESCWLPSKEYAQRFIV